MPTRARYRAILPATATPRRETHIHVSAPWSEPGPPLATGARFLIQLAGPCAVCAHACLPGDRVADLPDGRMVHVAGCVARVGV